MPMAAAISFTTSCIRQRRNLSADHTTIEKLTGFGTGIMHVSGSVLASAAMREKVLRVCKALHGRGAAISFDPNIRKELISDPDYFTTVNELMAICTYFLPSEDDADVLFPGENLESYALKLFAKGVDYVVLKKGDKGSSGIHRDGETYNFPAHKVDVVDPTGAGDCFCATFVTLISSGQFSFQKALQYANAAGAMAVTKVGPMEGNSTLNRNRSLSGTSGHETDHCRQPGRASCGHPVLLHRASRNAPGDFPLLPQQ